MTAILEPGVHRDLEESSYHASGGLSYSGAKVLLDCPARYRHVRAHPVIKREYDLGHIAHEILLGRGAGMLVVPAADWRTKDARDQRDTARAQGRVPILEHEHEAAKLMAKAVRDSSAGQLFDIGEPEVSLAWTDPTTGVPLRARVDWLHPNAVVDFKTCDKASPAMIRKTAYDYGYWIQYAAYTEGAAACGLGDLPMIFVFVEKAAPHIVTVAQPDDEAVAYGQRRWREAIDLYDACTKADQWPAYTADIETISLPAWAR